LGNYGSGDQWGELNFPQSATVDINGNIYVADTQNSRIQKFDANGKVVDIWGSSVVNKSNLVHQWALCTINMIILFM